MRKLILEMKSILKQASEIYVLKQEFKEIANKKENASSTQKAEMPKDVEVSDTAKKLELNTL